MSNLFYKTKNIELANKLESQGCKVIKDSDNCYFVFVDKQTHNALIKTGYFSKAEINQLLPTNKFHL